MVSVKQFTDFKKFAQRNVIQSIGAVENHTLLGHSLGQVLGCLRFSSASWTLRGPAQMQVECTE